MFSLKTFAMLAIPALFLIAHGVQGSPRSSSGSRSRGRSSSDSSFWFWAYTFSDSNWPKTPMSMEEFGRTNVDIMWQNRPAQAQAATCIQGPWFAKNYDNVSPSVRVSYFKKGFFPFTHNKVRNWDCLYIWGPDQQFYSEDDVKFDRMAVRMDNTKCSLDNVTMDISCL